MRMRPWIVAAALIVAAVLGGCDKKPAAAGGASASQTKNAAETYEAVHSALGPQLIAAVAKDEPADAMLAKHAADIDRLVEATRAANCDFGINDSQGLATELPHLATMRALTRVLKADAARQLAEGDADRAAQRAAAILRLSVHIAKNGQTTIELLVACAVASVGADFVSTHPELARAAWKTDIQQAIVSVEEGGVLNSRECVRRDGEMMARALRTGKMSDNTGMGGKNWPAASQAERDHAAERLKVFYAEALRVWDSAGAAATLKGLAEKERGGEIADLIPAIDKERQSVDIVKAACAKAATVLSK